MGSSSDDFGALRALLKVKQYEQPPPRYFDDLPHGVINRLRGPDGWRQKSLLSLLGFDFGLKQAVFYGLGMSCCLLALYSVVCLLVQESSARTKGAIIATSGLPRTPEGKPVAPTSHLLAEEWITAGNSVSTDPVLNPAGVAFPMDPFRIRPTPVKYELRH